MRRIVKSICVVMYLYLYCSIPRQTRQEMLISHWGLLHIWMMFILGKNHNVFFFYVLAMSIPPHLRANITRNNKFVTHGDSNHIVQYSFACGGQWFIPGTSYRKEISRVEISQQKKLQMKFKWLHQKCFHRAKIKGISWLGTLNGTLLQSNKNSKGKVWEDVPGFRQRAPS